MNSPPIRQILDVLFEPGQVIQVQINTGEINKKTGKLIWATGHYSDRDVLVQDILEADGQYPAIYVTLNPFQNHPPKNNIYANIWAVKAHEITHRRWLLIDFDPARESGTNSTAEEKEFAYLAALAVRDYLTSLGWAEPLLCDSGNGYHLLYRIDQPNDKQANLTLQTVLAGLDEKFTTPQVKIDRGVFDAQRITKLYGTWTMKGENTPERPQRRSAVLNIPDSLSIVTLEQLRMIQTSIPVDESPDHVDLDEQVQKILKLVVHLYPSEEEEIEKNIREQLDHPGPYTLEDLKNYLSEMGYTYGSLTSWNGGVRTFLDECYDKDGTVHYPPSTSHMVTFSNGWIGHDCRVCLAKEGKVTFPEFHARNVQRTGIDYQFSYDQSGDYGPPARFKMAEKSEAVQIESLSFLDSECRTELGNAGRFIQRHGEDIRHVGLRNRGEWAVWDGKRWKMNSDKAAAELMKETVRAILKEAVIAAEKARTEQEKEKAKNLFSWAMRSQSDKIIQAALKVALSDARVSVDRKDMDNSSMLLNVWNGTLDLNTLQLRPHNRADNLTTVSSVRFDAEATCPGFLKFIERILPDPEVRAFVQRWLGLCLTDDNGEQAVSFWYGEGSNGKTQLLEITRKILGPDYAKKAAFDTFRLGRKGETRNDLARLKGSRLVYVSESGEGVSLDESLLKDITGGEVISARFLYKEHFEYVPGFKPTFATNHKPEIHGSDYAIWRRIYLVPFDVTIPKSEIEKNINVRLFRTESSGILNWMLEGLRDYQNGGLRPPEEVIAATQAYKEEQDTIEQFLLETCELHLQTASLGWDSPFQVSNLLLYSAYENWAKRSGYRPQGMKRFRQNLIRKGLKTEKDRRGAVWFGLKMRGAASVEHTPEQPELRNGLLFIKERKEE